jgi:excisionase family DNA binding protein
MIQQNSADTERLSINEAATILNVHPNTLRNLISRNELAAERIGARIIRIRKSELLGLLTPYQGGEFGLWSKTR